MTSPKPPPATLPTDRELVDPNPVCRLGRTVRDGRAEMVLTVNFDRIDAELFRRFVAPRLLGPGFYLPTGLVLPVATTLRLELVLRDQLEPVSGAAVVLRHAQPGAQRGMVLRYTALDGRSLRLLRQVRAQAPAGPPVLRPGPAAAPGPAPTRTPASPGPSRGEP